MISLIALVMIAMGLLHVLINKFPNADRKTLSYHEPIVKPGRNGSFYFDDYDHFQAGVDGECICEACLKKRFTTR